jgi:hypothetical protein
VGSRGPGNTKIVLSIAGVRGTTKEVSVESAECNVRSCVDLNILGTLLDDSGVE